MLKQKGKTMRLIDADALPRHGNRGGLVHWKDIEDAPTVDAVKATMPWTNPDGTETMLDEVSYEIGYSQGQKDTNPYGLVLEGLRQVPMFTGKYDAKHGRKHFMFGVLTVLEYIADKAGNEEYSDMFLDNMNKSVYGDKAVE